MTRLFTAMIALAREAEDGESCSVAAGGS